MWFIHFKSPLLQVFWKRWIIAKINIVKFELSSRRKKLDLKHNTVLSMFQKKKKCFSYNNLGPFEYIVAVTRDCKFSGSMIN